MTHRHDDRAIGLLFTLDSAGPIGIRDLLDQYDLCESDLHGLGTELKAAGLIAETRVAGERGYTTTQRAKELLAGIETSNAPGR